MDGLKDQWLCPLGRSSGRTRTRTSFSLTGLCQPLITIEPVSGAKTRYQRGRKKERGGGDTQPEVFLSGGRKRIPSRSLVASQLGYLLVRRPLGFGRCWCRGLASPPCLASPPRRRKGVGWTTYYYEAHGPGARIGDGGGAPVIIVS